MINKIEITAKGGNGGDGLINFRHEKYIPFGGPDGGDGGAGGDVIIMANPNTSDLSLLKQKKKIVAQRGGQGGKLRKSGKNGGNLTILVPIGTMVFTRTESRKETLIADLTAVGQKVVVAKGGRGGLGNVHFATAVNQAPKIASKGELGEEVKAILELKLITDICIIGHPNSGKSTLLSAVSQARPQIADYPFTTRQPILGVIQDDRRDFIIAEIPGLVEGAHAGKGLGNEFLSHVERTKLIVYLLDGTSPTIAGDLSKLNEEVALYKADLPQKPKIIAVNKVDLTQVRVRLPEIRLSLAKLEVPVFYISAVEEQGILEFTSKAIEMVKWASQSEEVVLEPQIAVFHPRPKL